MSMSDTQEIWISRTSLDKTTTLRYPQKMEERRQSTLAKPSGLPRPRSRLPQPRASALPASTATLRPTASTEGLRGRLTQSASISDLRAANQRLRTIPSRDQLRKPRTAQPPVSLNTGTRASQYRTVSRGRNEDIRAEDVRFARPNTARTRPSGHFTTTVPASSDLSLEQDEQEKLHEVLPSLSSSRDEGITFDTIRAQVRAPRPSLSERTIETLSQLPSSPAIKRRGSNFFESDGVRRPSSRSGSSRPGSSYQSDGSTGRPLSRPGSSSGPSESSFSNFRSSINTFKPPLATVQGTPARRDSAITKTTSTTTPSTTSRKLQSISSTLSASVGHRTRSPEKPSGTPGIKHESKTLAARPLKPRASVNGLFKKPSLSSPDKGAPSRSELQVHPRKVSLASAKSSTASGEERNLSSASTESTAPTVDSAEETPVTARKSSAILRDQIAKAKAAKRATTKQISEAKVLSPEKSPLIPTDTTFDFGLSDDPFGQKQLEDSNRKDMQTRIGMARTTGRLNIAAMGLKEIPDDVLKMYDLESVGCNGSAWAECTDLTRFVAADNELETIDDSIFPDTDPHDFANDEDNNNNNNNHQFCGLESLDLHGNTLISLPVGLRRLFQLTSLNLTQNKLANACLETISQIVSLRDLKLGSNLLYGNMDPCFAKLENLEILDLHGNNISSLPEGLENLSRLRVLNISDNAFESLPFKSLSKTPLTELLAYKNKLSGTLIDADVESLPQLQTLDVSVNQLTQLTSGTISMPSLHQLTLSMNRLQVLPTMGSWKSLLTLTADENSISAIPDGFTSLEKLRNVDLTSNDIRVIPPEIARMDGLAMLRISGNPLRDKKFASLTTEELKDSLVARLEPLAVSLGGGLEAFGNGFDPVGSKPPVTSQPTGISESVPPVDIEDGDYDDRSDDDDFATPPTSAPASPARSRSHVLSTQTWPIMTGGILDRAKTQSSSLHPVICSKIAADQSIREVRLQHNTFTTLPNSLSFFADTLTTLSISHNQLVGENYLTEELDLTALKELNLSHNYITSLAPLTMHLRSPNLQKIDLSCNRIVTLPVMRDFFPSLTVLLVSSNHLEDLDPDSVSGLKVIDASNNDIAHLNPRLGLLGGTGNLERLDVTGNRFRVPRWNVMERGTEATLRWLRGRVPVAEMAEWRAKAENPPDDDSSFAELD